MTSNSDQQDLSAKATQIYRSVSGDQTIIMVKINGRLSRVHGRAFPGSNHIELARWTVADPTFLDETLRHEVAHHLAWNLERGKGHGTTWQKYATLIGASTNRTKGHSQKTAETKLALMTHKAPSEDLGFSVTIRLSAWRLDQAAAHTLKTGVTKVHARAFARKLIRRYYDIEVQILDFRGEVTNTYLSPRSS